MVANIWLRGFLRFSSKCGSQGLVRTGPLWPLRSPSHPLLRTQVRNCFHPGNVDIAREGIRFQRQAKKVTGKDMIKALSNYIWPKGFSFFLLKVLLTQLALLSSTAANQLVSRTLRTIQNKLAFIFYHIVRLQASVSEPVFKVLLVEMFAQAVAQLCHVDIKSTLSTTMDPQLALFMLHLLEGPV